MFLFLDQLVRCCWRSYVRIRMAYKFRIAMVYSGISWVGGRRLIGNTRWKPTKSTNSDLYTVKWWIGLLSEEPRTISRIHWIFVCSSSSCFHSPSTVLHDQRCQFGTDFIKSQMKNIAHALMNSETDSGEDSLCLILWIAYHSFPH